MLHQIVVMLVIFAGFVVCYLVCFNLFEKKADRLMHVLYIERDVKKYRQMMNSLAVKFFLSKKQSAIMDMSAFVIEQDKASLEKTFDYLDSVKLAPQQRLMVLQNELAYYAEQGNVEKAQQVLQTLEQKFGESNEAQVKALLQEAKMTVRVELQEDVAYLEEVLSRLNEVKDPTLKGIYQLRAARLYLKSQDLKKFDQMIQCAGRNLQGNGLMKVVHQLKDRRKNYVNTPCRT